MSSCSFKGSYVPDYFLVRNSNFLEFALKLYIKDKNLLRSSNTSYNTPTDHCFPDRFVREAVVCSYRTKGHAKRFYKVDKFVCLVCVYGKKLFTWVKWLGVSESEHLTEVIFLDNEAKQKNSVTVHESFFSMS